MIDFEHEAEIAIWGSGGRARLVRDVAERMRSIAARAWEEGWKHHIGLMESATGEGWDLDKRPNPYKEPEK